LLLRIRNKCSQYGIRSFFRVQDVLRRGSRFDTPEFDLYSHDVDVLGGFQDSSRNGKHPRGKRWAFMDWDFPGLERR